MEVNSFSLIKTLLLYRSCVREEITCSLGSIKSFASLDFEDSVFIFFFTFEGIMATMHFHLHCDYTKKTDVLSNICEFTLQVKRIL